MLDRIVTKITSARFLIAVILTIVFEILACTSRLSTEFLSVDTLVIAFYYNKDRTTSDTTDTLKSDEKVVE